LGFEALKGLFDRLAAAIPRPSEIVRPSDGTIARLVVSKFRGTLGQTMIVDSRSGANGPDGAGRAARR
jgi:tripartite-type tricarboxylate transporter receptor subunit TctC